MAKKLKNVFTYARFSSKNQKHESIIAQQRAMREYCKGKYNIVKNYVDEAKSAKNDDRPQFQKMIMDASKFGVEAIIVHKFDRFSRNIYDFFHYKCVLQKKGIRLISVIEPVEDSPEGRLFEIIMFGFAAFYIENMAREIEKGKKESAYQCLHLGGTPAYGYDVGNDRKYVINPMESQAVKKIFDMYLTDYSYQEIANVLNKCGYKTKKGLDFNKNSFISILENAERYTGVYMYNRAEAKRLDGTRNSRAYKKEDEIIKIPDGMPRIISDETYYQYLQKSNENKNSGNMFHSRRYYLLNGVMKCGKCGRMYSGCTSCSGRNKTPYSSYKCPNSRTSCNNKPVSMGYINIFVLNILAHLYCTEKNESYVLKRVNFEVKKKTKKIKNKIISLKNLLINKQSKLQKLVSSCEDEVNCEIDKLKEEIRNIEDRIMKLKASKPTPYTLEDIQMAESLFVEYMFKKDTPLCRKFIRNSVDEVLVYDDRVDVTLSAYGNYGANQIEEAI